MRRRFAAATVIATLAGICMPLVATAGEVEAPAQVTSLGLTGFLAWVGLTFGIAVVWAGIKTVRG